MGATLSSALDDCHLRDVPGFFHNFGSSMSSTRQGGDETYMVYAPSASTMSMSRTDNNNNDEQSSRASYSGPSQGHVRSDLVADYYKQSSSKQREVDPILSDLVDLCADGLEDEATRRQPAEGTDQPGGQVFKVPATPPPSTPQLTSTSVPVTVSSSPSSSRPGTPNTTGEWERAEAVVSAGGSSEHGSTTPGSEPLRTQRKKKKSSRKHKAAERELVNISNRHGQSAATASLSQGGNSYSHDGGDMSANTGTDVSSDAGTDPTMDDSSTSNATSHEHVHVRSERRASQDMSAASDGDDACRKEEARLKELLTISEGKEPAKEPLDSDDSDNGGSSGGWNLVNAEWYREWTGFLNGGPRPGQILNRKLMSNSDGVNSYDDMDGGEGSEGEPKLGLEVGVHFVGFDDRAWGILSEVYGADVRIARRRVDIYGR